MSAENRKRSMAFMVVGVMFIISAVFWLGGLRFLKRDTELATSRGSPNALQPRAAAVTQPKGVAT